LWDRGDGSVISNIRAEEIVFMQWGSIVWRWAIEFGMYVVLAAEQLMTAEKNGDKIAVEIKSFIFCYTRRYRWHSLPEVIAVFFVRITPSIGGEISS
jgi:hypothetical protein